MKSLLTAVKSILAVAGVAALTAVSAAPASAIGFSFSNIVNGDTPGDNYNDSFRFNVVDQGSSVLFNIFNDGDAAAPEMFIRQVFFDDNNFLSNAVANVGNSANVLFEGGVSNAQLAQGANDFTTDYAFTRENGGPANKWGVQAGENLGLQFNGNFASIISALNSGDLRLGLHVQSLPLGKTIDGGSDSYISTGNTEATPEPLTMLAAGAAVSFGAMFKKQRAQAQKGE